MIPLMKRIASLLFFVILIFGLYAAAQTSAMTAVFNIKDFGATGLKSDNARAAIERAVNACAAAGGGLVYVPPGDYSTGTIHLRSHVRFLVEAGATI